MMRNLDACCAGYLQLIGHFICLCEDGKIIWINDSGFGLLRSPNRENVINRPLADFITDDFAELFEDGLNLLADEAVAVPLNLLTVTADIINVNMHVSALPSENGQERHLVECQDISILTRAFQESRVREDRIRAILKAVDQAIFSIDEFGIIKSVNTVAEKIFGHTRLEMIGKNVTMLMPEPHRSNHDEYLMRYLKSRHSKIIGELREFEGLRADGTLFPIELTVTSVKEEGDRITFVGSIRDITVQRAQEERIRHLALNDVLTGLPNRASFNDRIKDSIARAERHETGVILMFIDLDKFKPINDTLGHEAGDLVLKTVAERLKGVIRKTDTAARIGGDEFVLVFENIENRDTIVATARTILEEISHPIQLNDTSCSVGASIGISHYPTDATTVPELLAAADKAMYKVKGAGRNNFSFC